MPTISKKEASPLLVVIAFATVYLVWGSTYFFIRKAVLHIPPMLLGAIRFLIAGSLLMGWSLIKGERIGNWQQIKPAIISGLLLLLIGNGAVIWAEKTLPSSLVAVSRSPSFRSPQTALAVPLVIHGMAFVSTAWLESLSMNRTGMENVFESINVIG